MRTKLLVFLLLPILFLLYHAFWWLGVWAGFIPEQPTHQVKLAHVHASLIDIGSAMETAFAGRSVASDSAYWGEFSAEHLNSIGLLAAEFVDPYHLNAPPKSLKACQARPIRDLRPVFVTGLDYQYYSDGKSFFMVISRGPDEALSFSQKVIETNKDQFLQSLKGGPVHFPSDWIELTYDPTNGSHSPGDIWRTSLR